MISQPNSYNLTVLCLKSCILAFASVLLGIQCIADFLQKILSVT